MTGAPLEVEIDELTLHGFDPRHGGAIGEALRAGIAEALAGWRPDPGSGSGEGSGAAGFSGFSDEGTAALNAGAVRVPAGAPAAQVGRAVGARVARALRDSQGSEAAGTAEGGVRA
jgi:hypothetical protein